VYRVVQRAMRSLDTYHFTTFKHNDGVFSVHVSKKIFCKILVFIVAEISLICERRVRERARAESMHVLQHW
jgi:hypothetical protein